MKFVIQSLVAIVLVVFCACSSPDSKVSYDEWLSENRKPAHASLLDFSYEQSSGDLIEEQIILELEGDTLLATFRLIHPVGCLLIGDVDINEDSVTLQIDQACDPNQEAFVSEVADLIFTYKLKAQERMEHKTFNLDRHSDLMNN